MSAGFAKVFSGLYEGSMIGAGVHVFALWPYCLARCDAKGFVEVNPRLAAHVLGCSIQEVEAALEYLQRPDPESRSQAEQGRRVVREGQFLYRIVNYAHYRDLRDAEARREYQREWVKEKRTNRQTSTEVDSRQMSTKSTKAEAEAEAEAERERERRSAPPRARSPRAKPAEEEWVEYAGEVWPEWPLDDVRSSWSHYQARGWKDISDWKAAARTCRHKWNPVGNGRGAKPAPVQIGARHEPGPALREVSDESPAWVQGVLEASRSLLRPAIPDELMAAFVDWLKGSDVPEPERWEMDLEAAMEEAKRLERPSNVARGPFGRRT